MTKAKSKVLILIVWTLFVCVLITERSSPVSGQTSARATTSAVPRKPDMALIDRFDKEIHTRFLTQPSFGMARLTPLTPFKLKGAHLSYFSPQTADEKSIVDTFNNEGWDVGIYLFGRRSEPKIVNGKQKNKFSIQYRVNEPVPVTTKLRERDMQESTDLIKEVKQAFLTYQTSTPEAVRNYEFDRGDWSYVARPVRAMNESCLKCHNDYVVIDKLDNGKFKFRKREVGDVNGILLFAFRKRK